MSKRFQEGFLKVKYRRHVPLLWVSEKLYCVLGEKEPVLQIKDRCSRERTLWKFNLAELKIAVKNKKTTHIKLSKTVRLMFEKGDRKWNESFDTAVKYLTDVQESAGRKGSNSADSQSSQGGDGTQGNSSREDGVLSTTSKDGSNDGGPSQNIIDIHEEEFLKAWFPDLMEKSYIIPIDDFYTMPVTERFMVEGNPVQQVRETTSEYDTVRKVHITMNAIKTKSKDKMVIMRGIEYSLYNNLYDGAADRIKLNRTKTLIKPQDLDDLLVIRLDYGLLLGTISEIIGKTVADICPVIISAIEYLNKAEDIVKSEILPGVGGTSEVAVHKTILLPNIRRQTLTETLQNKSYVRERLERCVGVQPEHGVTWMCLTKDDMEDEQGPEKWWSLCWGKVLQITNTVYTNLVKSFVVPLTTVTVSLSTQPRLLLWNEGQLVNAVGEEHGRDLTRIALFPEQVKLLDYLPRDDDVRIIHGSPGTAKTILLLMRGVSWSHKGCDRVYNIQTRDDGQAAAYLVSHQLMKTVARVNFNVIEKNMAPFWDENNNTWTKDGQQQVKSWCAAVADETKQRVHILADEANCDIISYLYSELKGRGCTVKLWAAGVELNIPRDMKGFVKEITAPLRCPPCVVKEVKLADAIQKKRVPNYTEHPVQYDALKVITIEHNREEQQTDKNLRDGVPWKCEECGSRVGTLLNDLLKESQCVLQNQGLHFNDVFIMGWDINCGPDTPDEDWHSPAPFIRGLEKKEIPTRKVDMKDTEAVKQVALNRWTSQNVADAVTIVNERTVWGLERKVVVYLDPGKRADNVGFGADYSGRLRSMSRCTAQLIWVKHQPY